MRKRGIVVLGAFIALLWPTVGADAVPTPAELGIDTTSCPQPWLPVFAAGNRYMYGPLPEWPDEEPPAPGPSIDLANL
ncbi:MAG TPA: hypothetical protein VIY72_03115, partial [Acidimicrobiales bacterium]